MAKSKLPQKQEALTAKDNRLVVRSGSCASSSCRKGIATWEQNND